MSYIQKNVVLGRRKGSLNFLPEFKQRLVAASDEPGVSITKLTPNKGIKASLRFKRRQPWRQGKHQLSSSPQTNIPKRLPISLDT